MSSVHLTFLGTGASGGTPGTGRSRRRESSLLVRGVVSVLLDVTRDVGEQLRTVRQVDTVLLTHAHRDAAGGLPQLRHWWRQRARPPIPLLAHPKTLAALEQRYAHLEHCTLVPAPIGRRLRWGPWELGSIEVPHANDPEVPTLAWKIVAAARVLVYASDVARAESDLAQFAQGAAVLVIDGATYRRSIFSHLRIDRDLPTVCRWDVDRILLTQIGRSAPPHEELGPIVTGLCERAAPAYDGLVVPL